MIRESIYSDVCPEPVHSDAYGEVLMLNRKVSFNKSGRVRIGRIISLYSEWENTGDYSITNRTLEEWKLIFKLEVREIESGDISTIKNPNSFVCIDDIPVSFFES